MRNQGSMRGPTKKVGQKMPLKGVPKKIPSVKHNAGDGGLHNDKRA